MTHKEILTKAIEKANAGDWDMFNHRGETVPPWFIVVGGEMPTPKVVEEWVPKDSLLICGYDQDYYFVWEYVIFNHDFAKALWGERYEAIDGVPDFKTGWQYHLQQMVIAKDPIVYLGEHLDG